MRTLPSLAHMISPTRRSSSHHGLEASPVHELSRVTGKPEVIGSSVGLVPTNALVLIEPIHSRMVNSEGRQKPAPTTQRTPPSAHPPGRSRPRPLPPRRTFLGPSRVD